MNRKHFARGSGVFSCTSCHRQTRMSAAAGCGALGFEKMCEQCYELAGLYNTYQDGGAEALAQYAPDIRAMCQTIVARGGTLDGDAQTLLEVVGDGLVQVSA